MKTLILITAIALVLAVSADDDDAGDSPAADAVADADRFGFTGNDNKKKKESVGEQTVSATVEIGERAAKTKGGKGKQGSMGKKASKGKASKGKQSSYNVDHLDPTFGGVLTPLLYPSSGIGSGGRIGVTGLLYPNKDKEHKQLIARADKEQKKNSNKPSVRIDRGNGGRRGTYPLYG